MVQQPLHEPDPEDAEAVEILVESRGWQLVEGKILSEVDRCLHELRHQRDPGEISILQGKILAYEAVVERFPTSIINQNRKPA